MKIRYLGHSCFSIEMQGVRIVTDPYGDVGFPMPRVKADAVTVSHSHYDHCNTGAVDCPHVFSRAGEYSVGGVRMLATEHAHDDAGGRKRGKTLAFRFEGEGMSLLHLGDIGEPATPRLAEELGHADVLLLPVGGNYTIDALGAKRYVELLRPNIVIPMHYMQEGLTVDIAGAEPFLRLFGGGEPVGDCVEILPGMYHGTHIFYMTRSKYEQ